MSESDIAWYAGIFEGEGTVTVHTNRNKYNYTQGRLCIAMSTLEVIERLNRIFPGSVTTKPVPLKEHHKQIYSYRVSKRNDLILIAIAIWPWLSKVRREQFRKVLDALAEQAQTRGAPWPLENERLAV